VQGPPIQNDKVNTLMKMLQLWERNKEHKFFDMVPTF